MSQFWRECFIQALGLALPGTNLQSPAYARWLADEGIASISLNPDSVVATWNMLAG